LLKNLEKPPFRRFFSFGMSLALSTSEARAKQVRLFPTDLQYRRRCCANVGLTGKQSQAVRERWE
jgi:hypothetical protein